MSTLNFLRQMVLTSKTTSIIMTVAHNKFSDINLQEHKDHGCIIYDVKGILSMELLDARL